MEEHIQRDWRKARKEFRLFRLLRSVLLLCYRKFQVFLDDYIHHHEVDVEGYLKSRVDAPHKQMYMGVSVKKVSSSSFPSHQNPTSSSMRISSKEK
jgi:hypothetical protein